MFASDAFPVRATADLLALNLHWHCNSPDDTSVQIAMLTSPRSIAVPVPSNKPRPQSGEKKRKPAVQRAADKGTSFASGSPFQRAEATQQTRWRQRQTLTLS